MVISATTYVNIQTDLNHFVKQRTTRLTIEDWDKIFNCYRGIAVDGEPPIQTQDFLPLIGNNMDVPGSDDQVINEEEIERLTRLEHWTS